MKYRIYIAIILVLLILYIAVKNYNNTPSSETKIMIQSATNPETIVTAPSIEKFANSTPTLKLYYTNWCGWSKKFLPTWDELTKNVKDVAFEKIDCEKQKCENVPGFPFIVLEKNGKKINYNGNRTYDDVLKFLTSN